MAYGIIKIDTITFTDGGIDKSVAISGLVQNPTFTGNVTVTGTISGNTVRGQTVSGVTITGTTAQFASGTFTSLTGVTVTGTTASFTSGNFTNISGGTHTITSGVFALGTAANPSISFTSDPNTGIYSPGADQVAISTNGTGRLFVDSSGRVGIGTTPSTALHLGGSSAQTIRINSATSAAFFGATGYITQIAANRNPVDGSIVNTGTATCFINLEAEVGNGNIQFCTTATNNASPTERMRLDSSGHLGLGTSAPIYTLDVVGFGQQSIRVASADGDLAILRMLSNGNNEWSLASDTVMRFRKDSTEYMRLDSSGRLGIGTGSPGTTLEVNGTISQTSQGTSSALYWAVNSGGTFYYGIDNSVGGSFGEAYAAALWHSGNKPMLFATNNSEKMRLDASGRLGLGTSSPQTGILDLTRNGTTGTISTYRQFRIGLDTNGNYSGFISYGAAASGGSSGLILESLDNGAASKTIINPSGGNVGIGVINPLSTLSVGGNPPTSGAIGAVGSAGGIALALSDNTNSSLYVRTATGGAIIGTDGGGLIRFATSGNSTSDEKARIDASGRLLVGTSTSTNNIAFNQKLAVVSTGNDIGGASFTTYGGTTNYNSTLLYLNRSRGTSDGSMTAVADGDIIGSIIFRGSNGSSFLDCASITSEIDGTVSGGGANDMPGRLVFSTTADGASSPTERARITSAGFFKASDNGTYFGATTAAHEFRTSATNVAGIISHATSTSYTDALHYWICGRSATNAYNFLVATSGYGGVADDEFKLTGDGNGLCDGSWTGGGADYAEYFEWSDANPSAEDRRGISVVLDGEKIRPALPNEDPIGVISGNPSVVGDAAWNKWSGKYLRDEFGTYIQEDYEVEDEDGNTVVQQRRKLNPAYDPDVEYISREERPEWDCVGLMGKLRLRKGQPTGSRWIKMRDVSDSVEEWLVR